MSDNRFPNPYNFIEINSNTIEYSLRDKPVYHDTETDDANLSGEILCEMETLTPTIVGNYVYKFKEYTDKNKYSKIPNDKTVIEPLKTSDGRVLISGSSIKGMIRNEIAALFSAPMERVKEEVYGYRPNNKFADGDAKLKPYAAIIVNNEEVNFWVKLVNIDIKNVIYVKSDCKENIKDGRIISIYGKLDFFKNKYKLLPSNNPFDLKDYEYYNYNGGFDGNKGLYKYLLIKKQSPKKYNNISNEVVENYKKTLDFIKDSENGHISSRNPAGHKEKIIKENIEQLKEKIFGENAINNTIIYVEARLDEKGEPDEITSMGHNFKYLWRYRDSIHKKDEENRSILTPLNDEISSPPTKLTIARLLFGYAAGKDVGNQGLGGNDEKWKKLAGRVSFNHAVEIVEDNKKNPDQRFVMDNDSYDLFLKILGSPKASAVEYYLKQGSNNRNDGGIYNSYGDTFLKDDKNDYDDPSGELRGRKFYIHQSDAANNCSLYKTDNNEEKVSNQSAIARYISKPETKFRFSIRFRHLRKWELELLLFVLELNNDNINSLLSDSNEYKKNSNRLFAHKIGHGRPLGLGSVKIKVDKLNILTRELEFEDETKKYKNIENLKAKIEEFYNQKDKKKKWENQIFTKWLKIHQYTGNQRAGYRTKDGKVFKYHMDIRGEHIKGRRNKNKQTDNFEDRLSDFFDKQNR